MSLKIVKTFALDFTRNAPLEYIFVKAGDKNSRVLNITPLNSGLPYQLPAGVSVVFIAKKPDKTEILNDATVNTSTGHIEVTLSEQTLAAEGILVCEVALYNADEFLSSQHFYLKASPLALTDIESSNEYKSLVVALLSVDEKIREAETIIDKASTLVSNIEKSFESGDFNGADGISPHIGENGHWWVGETDTGVKAVVEVSWNDLTDKPFDENVTFRIVSNSETAGVSTFEALGVTYGLFNSEFPPLADIVGSTLIMSDSGEVIASGTVTNENILLQQEKVMLLGADGLYMFVATEAGQYTGTVTIEGVANEVTVNVPEAGIYLTSEDIMDLIGGNVDFIWENVKIVKIDDKYLPDNIGSGLPEVTTTDNGKFLQVVNGAWTAVALTDVSQEGA